MSLHKIPQASLSAGLCLAICFFASPAWSQNQLELQAPTSAVACLQTHAGEDESPVYPADELTLKASASVSVQLTFRSPDAAPKVKVLKNTGTDVFADAVEAFVKRYRLPCMVVDGAPVVAVQDFLFEPGDGRKVVYGAVKGEAPKLDAACFSFPTDKPYYPRADADAGRGGTVLAEFRFHETNAEPSVHIIYGANSARLAASAVAHVKAYRLVCPMPSAEPIMGRQTFVFRVTGQERYFLKDMDLKSFLQITEPADRANAKFNFNTMGCPFDLSVRVRRPHADNLVGEYGESDLRRQEFVKWVSGLRLQLPKNLEPYLFDQQVKLSVPCLVLDL